MGVWVGKMSEIRSGFGSIEQCSGPFLERMAALGDSLGVASSTKQNPGAGLASRGPFLPVQELSDYGVPFPGCCLRWNIH
jgi:hypothetical protein